MAIPLSLVGFAYLAGVKLTGYCFAGAQLRRRFRTARPHPLVFGLAMLLVGGVAGTSASLLFSGSSGERVALFYLLLAPIRFVQWYLALTFFFGQPQAAEGINVDSTLRYTVQAVERQEHFIALSGLGVLWSYLLDVPIVLSLFTITNAAWIS